MPKTALIVDDSTSLRQMVAFTMKEAGFDVVEGENGQEALDKSDGKNFDLVITDLNMPVMDGITLIRKLRERPNFKFTPILMLTTESQDTKKQEGKAAGATGWIVKPFNPEQMLQVVARVVP
jgi:two-component system chemotaxis response regulator CheY